MPLSVRSDQRRETRSASRYPCLRILSGCSRSSANGRSAEDRSHFFTGTDFSVMAAGGMIIQMLPDAQEGAVDALEEMLADLPPITALVEEATGKAGGQGEEKILSLMMERIFGNMPEEYGVSGLEFRDLRWECDCSEERLEQVLMTIGEKDLTDIIEEDGQAELVCQFCCKKYHFDKEHLERILASIRQV